MKTKLLPLLLLSLSLIGCSSTRTEVTYTLDPTGHTNSVSAVSTKGPFYATHILKHSTRIFGFQFKQDPQTQIPYAVLGFGSELDEMIPTARGTNGISAPRVMTAFKLQNSMNPFSTGIEENSGAGDVYIGGTNDTSKAIIPSAFVPKQNAP